MLGSGLILLSFTTCKVRKYKTNHQLQNLKNCLWIALFQPPFPLNTSLPPLAFLQFICTTTNWSWIVWLVRKKWYHHGKIVWIIWQFSKQNINTQYVEAVLKYFLMFSQQLFERIFFCDCRRCVKKYLAVMLPTGKWDQSAGWGEVMVSDQLKILFLNLHLQVEWS